MQVELRVNDVIGDAYLAFVVSLDDSPLDQPADVLVNTLDIPFKLARKTPARWWGRRTAL
jgi:hypothetical protein